MSDLQHNYLTIDAKNLDFKALNRKIKQSGAETIDIAINNCAGQRFIGSGLSQKHIVISGTPGNALGAYLDGALIDVNGNAQDAVGDTMNEGKIIIQGNVGDALGYAMRGGKIYVKGDSGYRTGIHMKQYEDKKPVIIVGGRAGSFLGEYLAGGIIIVLGLEEETNKPRVGNFTGTGMHGGKIFIRCDTEPEGLPAQVAVARATQEDMSEIMDDIKEYAAVFSLDYRRIIDSKFYVLKPNAKNPYKQLYITN